RVDDPGALRADGRVRPAPRPDQRRLDGEAGDAAGDERDDPAVHARLRGLRPAEALDPARHVVRAARVRDVARSAAAGGRVRSAQRALKYALCASVRNAASAEVDDSTRQSVSFETSNQRKARTAGKSRASELAAAWIHAALSPPASADAVSATMIGFFAA